MVPRENKNNAWAKFGGQTKSIMVFSEVAYLELFSRVTSRGLKWENKTYKLKRSIAHFRYLGNKCKDLYEFIPQSYEGNWELVIM